jgi:Holliday junction resolvase RusA-like endonuclease
VTLLIVARGVPVTQGSKTPFAVRRKDTDGQWEYTGKAVMSEGRDRGVKVKAWRQDVADAAREALAGAAPITGPVAIRVTFTLARPAGHYGSGRNAGLLRPSAPAFPAVKPDQDKLLRAVCDALRTAGVYRDDAQVVDAQVAKRYQLGPGDAEGIAAAADFFDVHTAQNDVLAGPGAVIRAWQMTPRVGEIVEAEIVGELF